MRSAGIGDQHLIMGPWADTHYDQYHGELNFGPAASASGSGVVASFNRFIDKHLRDGKADLPVCSYFVLGANRWQQSDAWPPREAEAQLLYLHSSGAANTASGDGTLTEAPAAGSESADSYVYHPQNPVPTIDPPGPRDQRAVETRDDVLCYTSAPFEATTTVAGPVTLELWAISDASDTDWTAKLVDVAPDGTARQLCDGIMRATFRDSLSAPTPIRPGQAERYVISLGSIACQFPAGHRARLEVSSSNFPKFDANPNTGASTITGSASQVAVQQVLHSTPHASVLRWSMLKAP